MRMTWAYAAALPLLLAVVERRVDQRKIVTTAYDAELPRAEQLAELARGHCDRPRLADARLPGRGERVGKRHRRVQRDVAFDLLQHLMDVAIQNGHGSERTQKCHHLGRIRRAPTPRFPHRPEWNVPEHDDRR